MLLVYCYCCSGDSWLVGGASNTGGVVLRQYFSNQQLQELTSQMDISQPTGFDYYPLVKPGERFPINDQNLLPRLEPRPVDDVKFLQGEVCVLGLSALAGEILELWRFCARGPTFWRYNNRVSGAGICKQQEEPQLSTNPFKP